MDATAIALVQTLAFFLALYFVWWRLDRKLDSFETKLTGQIRSVGIKRSGEPRGVCQGSDAAYRGITDQLSAIEMTQATHSERFNTVQTQIQSVDDKVDRLREGK